jgi:hypothetical protein
MDKEQLQQKSSLVRLIALITPLNGVLNLYAALHPHEQSCQRWSRGANSSICFHQPNQPALCKSDS